MKRWLPLPILALGLFPALTAQAQSWRGPDHMPRYVVELEPHLALGAFDPPGIGTGAGIGPGLRASIPILPRGVLPTVNDSIGITFGLDWAYYDAPARSRGFCSRFAPSPDGTPVCVEVDGQIGDSSYFYLPIAAQWNFFLIDRVSVFAEPGLNLYLRHQDYGGNHPGITFNVQAGGRFMFTDMIAVTLRLGYPLCTLGASFFL